MQRRDINAADAPAPARQYTQAVEVTGASRTLYISGQVGIASDGSVPEDAEAQCALAWRTLRAQLRAAGMCGSAGDTSGGRHAHHRRSQQSSLEGRGGGHRSRLIARRIAPVSKDDHVGRS